MLRVYVRNDATTTPLASARLPTGTLGTGNRVLSCRFQDDVLKPVEAALQRCGCKVTFTTGANSAVVEGLPDFQVWYQPALYVQSYDFTGGEGNVGGRQSVVLTACELACLPMCTALQRVLRSGRRGLQRIMFSTTCCQFKAP